jgi:O-antigen/teichoic acid export membrane protein/polysaccharide pyruvyl transferase WcaK-like protein
MRQAGMGLPAGGAPMPGTPAGSTLGLGRTAGRGAATTLGGQVIRITVQLTGIIILGHLLSPSDYGLIASVTAIIGIGEVFRDFGLSSAAIQARQLSRHQKDNLFWVNSGIGLALTAAAFGCSGLIAGLYGDLRLGPLTRVLAFTFLLNGLATQFRADLNRNFRFVALTGSEIAAQLGGLVVGIAMATTGWGYWALAGQQVSQGVLTLVFLVPVTRWFPRGFHRRTDIRHFLRFGSNVFGTQMLGYASRNVDSVVIGATLGPGPLGLYNRAFQLLLLPLNQINAPSTRVALPVLSRLQDDTERYARFITLGQRIMLHLVTLVLALAAAQAAPIILITLGGQWLGSAPIFQILSVAGFFQVAGYATYWVFLSKGLMRQNFYFSLITRPLLIVFVLVGSFWGVYGVAAGYSIGMGLSWPLSLWWISRVSDAPALDLFLAGARAAVGYGVAAVVSVAATLWVPSGWPVASLVVGAAALLAAVALIALAWPAFRQDVLAIAASREFLWGAPGSGRKRMRALQQSWRRNWNALVAASGLTSALDRAVFRRAVRGARAEAEAVGVRAGATAGGGGASAPGAKTATDRAKHAIRDAFAHPGAIHNVFARGQATAAGHGPESPAAAAARTWHVLIAPPGGGNIGDQAMVEAFLENTTGGVRIVVRTVNDLRVPHEYAGRAEVHALPALIHGVEKPHRRDIAALGRLLASARSLTVVGADAMDGAYDARASVRRADVATLAAGIGLDARILGFSWNSHARAGARRALKRAGRAGVRLLVRDPISSARARRAGFRGVVDTADAVFSARTSSPGVVEQLLGGSPPPYAVVNPSGLVGRSMDQAGEYTAIVRALLDRGISVVLLPHVIRSSASDLTYCRTIAARVDDARVVLVEGQLIPAEVRGLCAGAQLVLAGRMHLAIQSLWSAVPAVTLSTQGKVEGLMQLFGSECERLCVTTGAGLAGRVVPLIDELLADRAGWSARIAARLPSVKRLADVNFDGLGEAGARVVASDPERAGAGWLLSSTRDATASSTVSAAGSPACALVTPPVSSPFSPPATQETP